MLVGLTRKLSIPVLLLSLAGWITYGVGFGLRNFRYRDLAQTTAASPQYIFLWIFLCAAPLAIALSFLQALWDSKVPGFLANLVVPSFLMSAGAVMFLDGIIIYKYHQQNINLFCRDSRIPEEASIHGDLNFIPVEFAGAVTSLMFYWLYFLMVPFFATKYEMHERY